MWVLGPTALIPESQPVTQTQEDALVPIITARRGDTSDGEDAAAMRRVGSGTLNPVVVPRAISELNDESGTCGKPHGKP